MKLDETMASFKNDLQIRNYSSRTVVDYGYHLLILRRYLELRHLTDLASVTTAILVEFQRWLYYEPTKLGRARGVLNQNGILAAVKALFRFLNNEGCLPHDPAAALEYAREPQSLPRNVLTPEEAKHILDSVDCSTALGLRDRTILEILYATGIRKEELRNLTIGDVSLDEALLRINLGKGGRDRLVPLGSVARRLLETYIKGVRPELLGTQQTDRLFLSFRGLPLDPHTIGALVTRHARLAGVKKHVTCHVWRHTCATHLVQNHANLRHVQDLLGHRSLTTTERYLRLTITDLKEAHARFHPREQEEPPTKPARE